MGTFRLLLAAAVVISHSAPIAGFPILSGGLAVKVFFIVSGFYMALILSEKYQPRPNGLWLFFSNRFLRIFPIFWLILLVEIILGWIAPPFATNASSGPLHRALFETSGPGIVVTLGLTEIGLLGNEWFSLLAWMPEQGLQWWTTATSAEAVRGWQLTSMPHAWTLACEVAFYLAAPSLNRCRSLSLILIATANLVFIVGLPHLIDPRLAEAATDYWAPLQIGFFVIGMLAWRALRTWPWAFKGRGGQLLMVLLLALLFGFNTLSQISNSGALLLLFTVAATAIPALFITFRDRQWDRNLGDLSYPVYLCHPLAVHFLSEFGPSWFPNLHFTESSWLGLSAVLLSCTLAWLMTQLIERPLDRIRQRRVPETSSQP